MFFNKAVGINSEESNKTNVVSTKYIELAEAKNKELDTVRSELDEYREEIKNIHDEIGNEFPDDKSFYLGIAGIINKINVELDNFQTNIENMKESSLKVARKKDADRTMLLNNVLAGGNSAND